MPNSSDLKPICRMDELVNELRQSVPSIDLSSRFCALRSRAYSLITEAPHDLAGVLWDRWHEQVLHTGMFPYTADLPDAPDFTAATALKAMQRHTQWLKSVELPTEVRRSTTYRQFFALMYSALRSDGITPAFYERLCAYRPANDLQWDEADLDNSMTFDDRNLIAPRWGRDLPIDFPYMPEYEAAASALEAYDESLPRDYLPTPEEYAAVARRKSVAEDTVRG